MTRSQAIIQWAEKKPYPQAAMIGLAAYYHKGNIPELFSTSVDSNLELK